MKKILSIILSVMLIATVFAGVISAEDKVYTCGFDNAGAGYKGTGYFGGASATYFTSAKSVYLNPIYFEGATGALGDLTSGGEQPGTRRSLLFDLSETVPAGTYTVSVMLKDNGVLSNEKSDLGVLLTLHGVDATDDTVGGKWYDDTASLSTIKIVDNHGKAVAGDDYMDATMTNAGTVNNPEGKEWTKYTAVITLSAPAAKCAVWVYQPGGALGDYNNQFPKGDNHVYVDDLTITPYTAPATGDLTAVVAAVSVIALAGVAFAAKKH